MGYSSDGLGSTSSQLTPAAGIDYRIGVLQQCINSLMSRAEDIARQVTGTSDPQSNEISASMPAPIADGYVDRLIRIQGSADRLEEHLTRIEAVL